jgi:phosphate/sulfate permease
VVASILIAYGTSQKLPLSTTFVTFMVAMGSSFADQAWGRESAVYRVAGVINVIAGWLVTALVALLASGGNLLTGRLYIRVFDLMQDLYQSTRLINDVIMSHVVNHHSPPKKKYAELTFELEKQFIAYTKAIVKSIEATHPIAIHAHLTKLQALLNNSLDELITDIQKDELGNRMGMLQTRVMLELRDLTETLADLDTAYHAKEK